MLNSGKRPAACQVEPAVSSVRSISATSVQPFLDRKSTRLNSSHLVISYAVFCLKKKHKNSSDTPDSMKLADNLAFTRDETKVAVWYRNLKDSVVYTFLIGTLKPMRNTFIERTFR